MPYGYYGYYFDPTYILIIIAAIISLIAQWRVNSAFSKYSRVASMSGMTGAQAARMILQSNGINDVSVQRISGKLTDHYNPSTKVLNLSESVYGSTSVAAIGVAAHECGHAIQHARHYVPLTVRSAIIPAANIGSSLAWPLVLIGLIIPRLDFCMTIGILLFSIVVILQLVTLPVEFNASRRAIQIIRDSGYLAPDELKGAKSVLKAAAMTYVAAMVSVSLQLLRLVILRNSRDDN